MIDPELLKILCCPETHQKVVVADAALVRRINDQINSGNLRNRSGTAVKEAVDGGLLREDGKFLYPIRQDIPIMLIDEAIPVA